MDGYVYLIRDGSIWGPDIYKIGQTKNWSTRLSSYGSRKEINVFRICKVRNYKYVEKQLKVNFSSLYTPIKGHEYFEGPIGDMLLTFDSIVKSSLNLVTKSIEDLVQKQRKKLEKVSKFLSNKIWEKKPGMDPEFLRLSGYPYRVRKNYNVLKKVSEALPVEILRGSFGDNEVIVSLIHKVNEIWQEFFECASHIYRICGDDSLINITKDTLGYLSKCKDWVTLCNSKCKRGTS